MKLTSPDFKDSELMPAKFTHDGENINPTLSITEIPARTKSITLIVDDPDAPAEVWVHWVVYNIPPHASLIKQNSLPGLPGINTCRKKTYDGACPPSGIHRYFFKVYALDIVLPLRLGADKHTVYKAMEGHVIDKAELIGLYKSR